jgi:hypothetical protein
VLNSARIKEVASDMQNTYMQNMYTQNMYLVRTGFDWVALETEVRAQIRRHAHARWRQEVVFEEPADCPWPVPYRAPTSDEFHEFNTWINTIFWFSFRREARSIADI